MGKVQDEVAAVKAAYEKEEGIRPVGSAQAALLNLLDAVAARVDLIEQHVIVMQDKMGTSASATMTRIEQKLDLVLDQDQSIFGRVFGKTR